MKKTVPSVLAIPEIELKHHFWLDLGYLGGVDYRFGWRVDDEVRSYVVVFRGGASTNGKPVRGPAVLWAG
ncbi:hypothetical protein Achl_4119 (plasmid) [Pseudarthrobacter chlorophenolicus A6]|uniref:Uncharacterized protein n=1 Tax=Pseudarthrobacter chlorophenolicus (strain ATCC 700700 / DSM 12829 / CIP 107037 / JCM 12360 / KCTC 9906 / NCIMB 13794 / A6) TaxID=452863 RepID=B8HI23_PSECP|nr:hypothetical protein Achl_4119 [Pseudarthrobacter chlorophenolicus A6]SDQ13017.1 hypothetical protein SAMN04489738_0178 [Pseudarthrobacter chlorophenolicus]SDQ21159.1 hypothetical protein SAMN04489738_0769 [Pseudarthrobacter chlorophenolicus]